MATTRTTLGTRALAALTISVAVLLLVAFAAGTPAQAGSSNEGCTGSYGWPVKPFDQAHPVRGAFGDPRTVFDGPRTQQTLLEGDGNFGFHFGVDISAPDGTPVYAVASGLVTQTVEPVIVECGNGRTFQYWHVEPVARVGQRAEAGKTLLGFIQRGREHVHLTQLQQGTAVSPVSPGRLFPYRDTTIPKVLGISIRGSDPDLGTSRHDVSGHLRFVAEAIDTPSLPVPGRWHGFPVTPARLTWRIVNADGRIVVRERIARDVSQTLPTNDGFWDTFARGTYQNWPVFDGHKQRFLTGRYLFKLAREPFDTHTLRDGDYELVVTAEDIGGNRDVRRLRFTVHNDPGWR